MRVQLQGDQLHDSVPLMLHAKCRRREDMLPALGVGSRCSTSSRRGEGWGARACICSDMGKGDKRDDLLRLPGLVSLYLVKPELS